MAVLILRMVPVAKFLEKMLGSPLRLSAGVPSYAARSLNTNVQRLDLDEVQSMDGDLRGDGAPVSRWRCAEFPYFFSDVQQPFRLDPEDPLLQDSCPLLSPAARGPGVNAVAPPRLWLVRGDGEAVHLFLDMPGLGKEHVRVWAEEEGTLVIKGKGDEQEERSTGREYGMRINLAPELLFSKEKIKADMKYGVLKISLPKMRETERKDVTHINIE